MHRLGQFSLPLEAGYIPLYNILEKRIKIVENFATSWDTRLMMTKCSKRLCCMKKGIPWREEF
jgi:hypothetical protein